MIGAGGGDDVGGRAEVVEQVAGLGVGGVGRQAGLDVTANLCQQLLTLSTGEHPCGAFEAPKVLAAEWVDGDGHGVGPFGRRSSTASRKRRHSVVNSARARRPWLVMA